MKKIISFIIAMTMLFSIFLVTACDKKDDKVPPINKVTTLSDKEILTNSLDKLLEASSGIEFAIKANMKTTKKDMSVTPVTETQEVSKIDASLKFKENDSKLNLILSAAVENIFGGNVEKSNGKLYVKDNLMYSNGDGDEALVNFLDELGCTNEDFAAVQGVLNNLKELKTANAAEIAKVIDKLDSMLTFTKDGDNYKVEIDVMAKVVELLTAVKTYIETITINTKVNDVYIIVKPYIQPILSNIPAAQFKEMLSSMGVDTTGLPEVGVDETAFAYVDTKIMATLKDEKISTLMVSATVTEEEFAAAKAEIVAEITGVITMLQENKLALSVVFDKGGILSSLKVDYKMVNTMYKPAPPQPMATTPSEPIIGMIETNEGTVELSFKYSNVDFTELNTYFDSLPSKFVDIAIDTDKDITFTEESTLSLFKFTPTEAGTYQIDMTAKNTAEIYYIDVNCFATNFDLVRMTYLSSGEKTKPATVELEANKTYYFAFNNDYYDLLTADNGTYTIKVTKLPAATI